MSAEKIRIAVLPLLWLVMANGNAQIPLQDVDPWFDPDINSGGPPANEQQVGACLIEAKGGGTPENCTANDFSITDIDITNVIDACTDPDDYMQVDLEVVFTKTQPTRYDVAAWFYRGDNTAGVPNPAFQTQDAQNGELCTRFTSTMVAGTAPAARFANVDNDAVATPGLCLDAVGSAGPLPPQSIQNLVLPCRDGDTNANPVLAPDGIVDVHGCTTWDNNAGSLCDGPYYDGVNEPDPGTTSKCNCGNFQGVSVQIGLPNLTIEKQCAGIGGADINNLSPGDQVVCEVTINNNGFGNADGATSMADTGFFWRDDYPDQFDFVGISGGPANNNSLQAVSPTVSANSDYPGEVAFYPDDIMGNIVSGTDGEAYFFYTLELNSGFPPSGSIENTVCTFYDNGTTIIEYENGAGACDSVTFTPITLSSFLAERDPSTGELVFNWATSTEAGNLGFNLYAVAGKALLPVNDVMISSSVVDSRTLTGYEARFADPTGGLAKRFYIEDVDMFGNTSRHGPFRLGEASGADGLEQDVVPTDWKKFKQQKKQQDKQRGKSFASRLNNKGQPKKGGNKRTGNSGGENSLLASSLVVEPDLVVRVLVDESGIQRITYDDLASLGLSMGSASADSIAMTRAGAPVPVNVQAGNAGGFGPGSYIEFIGEAHSNLYTDSSVYQLDLMADSATSAMAKVKATPKGKRVAAYYMHTERRAQNNDYNYSSPIQNEPWYDTRQLANRAQNLAGFSLPASNVAPVAGTIATLTAQIAGGLDYPDDPSDHHVLLDFNGTTLVEEWFDGIKARTLSADLDPSQIGADNLVESFLPADTLNGIDLVYVESIELSYPRAFVAIDDQLTFTSDAANFAVTSFSSSNIVIYADTGGGIVRLSNFGVGSDGGGYAVRFAGTGGLATYYVSTGDAVRSPDLDTQEARSLEGLSANHLVISHPSLMGDVLNDYLAARESRANGTTELISVFDIYDQYSAGITDGEAIGALIRDVASRSELESVLLVGGDTYDYKGYLDPDIFSLVPTIYRQTDAIIYYSAVDALFGDIDGDLVPDVAVGRLPVRSVEELATLAAKIGQYNTGLGEQSAVVAADDTGPDDAYNYSEISELIATPLEQDGWDVTRAYLGQLSVAEARSALIGGMNAGPRLTTYTGHSAATLWTFDGLFRLADAAALTNHGDPTLVVQWGCWNTYFVHPTQDSLGHVLMLSGDQGAATVVGASTLTNAGAEKKLAELLHNAIVDDSAPIGAAMIGAKQAYAAQYGSGDRDILWGVSILGDPLIRVK